MSRRWTRAALALGLVALTALVWTGALHGADQWAVDHVMPGVRAEPEQSLPQQLIPFAHPHGVLDVLADIVVLAGHPVLTTALVIWLAWAVPQRRVAILGGFVLAVGLEVTLKHVVERPALHLGSYHLTGFDHSFPSGHATRTVFVALVAAAAFPRAARLIAAWLGAIVVVLVVDGFHTPTDVLGGILLGALLALAVKPASTGARIAP